MRVPPNNADAEKSVLGCMMQDREALSLAFELLTADDFYQPANREIFDAMHALNTQGMPIDLVTVDDELTRRGTLEGVGGSNYLVELSQSMPSTVNARAYVQIVDEKATHRLVLTECRTEITPGVICVLDILVEKLEYLLTHEAEEEDPDRDMEQIFVRILSDRTADYMQVSRELTELGWSGNHEYMCLILQITYLNQQNLSTKAICRYIKKKVPDSVSFLYQDEIVVFFDLTRLGMTQEDVAGKLIYFIRDTYLKAGYSRVMEGHMNLRRQYVQAKTALDVGSRKKPYLWIHYFSQVALTYILEQSTRRLSGSMICHEGLLELKRHDRENQTQYMETLRVYLEQHLSATQAARELFIHRSTFLYRLDRIKEILQSDLDDPEEIFYLELSFRLLEQEEEKE